MMTKTVDKAIRTLGKVVSDLEAVVKAKAEEEASINLEVTKLVNRKNAAITEIKRAERIREKIEGLLE